MDYGAKAKTARLRRSELVSHDDRRILIAYVDSASDSSLETRCPRRDTPNFLWKYQRMTLGNEAVYRNEIDRCELVERYNLDPIRRLVYKDLRVYHGKSIFNVLA